jgi:phosphoribosylformylglycinamidine synthase
LDPQGKAVHHALSSLGFGEVENVRIGKQIVLDVADGEKAQVMARAKEMCEELLANTVIEDYEIEIR